MTGEGVAGGGRPPRRDDPPKVYHFVGSVVRLIELRRIFSSCLYQFVHALFCFFFFFFFSLCPLNVWLIPVPSLAPHGQTQHV